MNLKQPGYRNPIPLGEILAGRYRIDSLLGSGGMGDVYLAEDSKLPGKLWAIKAAVNPSPGRKSLHDEARWLSMLDHPFLPKIADSFLSDHGDYHFLVMDFVKGRTLQALFEEGKLTYLKAVRYASQLCELFMYLHGLLPEPLVYRDLKPSNVMIDEQDNVRLIDFGIARLNTGGRKADTIRLGTIGFAAPEQFEDRETDSRTDLYTLGAMLYYLFSGGRYYRDLGLPAQNACPGMPLEFAQIVMKLLEDDPNARYPRAEDVKAELDKLLYTLNKPLLASIPPESTSFGAGRRKLVIVGGLYPGAGSTFVSLTLCHALKARKIAHSLVEFGSPELYDMLYGDKMAPQPYHFLQDELVKGGIEEEEVKTSTGSNTSRVGEHQLWTNGYTEWVPRNPMDVGRVRTREETFRLLHVLKQPLVLVDVSADWEGAENAGLLTDADLVIGVVGPFPSKLNSARSQKGMERLGCLRAQGITTETVAVRDTDFTGRKEWLRSISLRPVCHLPEIPHRDIVQCQWKGTLIQEHEEYESILIQAIQPLADKIAYVEDSRKSGMKASWFARVLGR